MPATAMDEGKLSDHLKGQLEEVIHDVQTLARRAKVPEDRMALAYIERGLLEMQKNWQRAGLINGQEMLPLAAEKAPRRH